MLLDELSIKYTSNKMNIRGVAYNYDQINA